jgi:hypothetical protein
MKITIKQAILNEHLNNVIKGISSKNIIPDQGVKMAINLEKMCNEYLAEKGINIVE